MFNIDLFVIQSESVNIYTHIYIFTIYIIYMYSMYICIYIYVSLYQSPYLLQAGFLNQDSLSSSGPPFRCHGPRPFCWHFGNAPAPWGWKQPLGATYRCFYGPWCHGCQTMLGGLVAGDVKARDNFYDVYIIQCKIRTRLRRLHSIVFLKLFETDLTFLKCWGTQCYPIGSCIHLHIVDLYG